MRFLSNDEATIWANAAVAGIRSGSHAQWSVAVADLTVEAFRERSITEVPQAEKCSCSAKAEK
jgi:hypothetical protein